MEAAGRGLSFTRPSTRFLWLHTTAFALRSTAFAVVGEPIPCVTTAMADEFGGEIPCCSFCLIGGEEIGRLVVDKLTGHRSPAALLQNHGVFRHSRR